MSPRGGRDGAQTRNQSINFINSKMLVAVYGGDVNESKSQKSNSENTQNGESSQGRMQAKNI